MEKRKIGFKGEMYKEISLDDYVDKWILLKFRNGNSTFGYLESSNKREANLLPYYNITRDENGKLNHGISENGLPDTYEKMDIVGYRPSSREEVENFCNGMNQEATIEFLKKKKESFELEKISSEIDSRKRKIIKYD